MNDTTLINIEDIKAVTSISENVDTAQLEPFLFTSSEMFIRPIVGDALMDAMVADVATGGTTYESLINNQILLPLAYATWYSASPFLAYKTHKKGVVKQNSENSENLTVDEMSIYNQRIENSMTFYLRRLTTHLNDNKTLYPLYASADQINPKNSSSIFLGF